MSAWGVTSGATAGEPVWLLNAAAKGDTATVVEQLRRGVPVRLTTCSSRRAPADSPSAI